LKAQETYTLGPRTTTRSPGVPLKQRPVLMVRDHRRTLK